MFCVSTACTSVSMWLHLAITAIYFTDSHESSSHTPSPRCLPGALDDFKSNPTPLTAQYSCLEACVTSPPTVADMQVVCISRSFQLLMPPDLANSTHCLRRGRTKSLPVDSFVILIYRPSFGSSRVKECRVYEKPYTLLLPADRRTKCLPSE
ncbi:hypothetical protein J6590_002154 [Homalodisca vitripennis]|nr:hypothetical protein J6590_002154 [Homalodisca vitripennis]